MTPGTRVYLTNHPAAPRFGTVIAVSDVEPLLAEVLLDHSDLRVRIRDGEFGVIPPPVELQRVPPPVTVRRRE